MRLVVVQNKAEVWAFIHGSGLLTELECKHAWSLIEKVTMEAPRFCTLFKGECV